MTKMSLYFSTGRPLRWQYFETGTAPIGWIRQDILVRKVKNPEYRAKFTEHELYMIEKEDE